MPIVVLTRGRDCSPAQQAAHAEIAKLSRNSRHVVVPDSYHEIHLSHPEAVAGAIADVVAAVRGKSPLRSP
jgi:pimeloyl-ACP methyl ester carboxylesterase